METTGVGGQTPSNPASALTAPKQELGRDAFLQLLVTQLQHQDPTAPQANGEFIAQLATFSSLEQLTQMQKSLESIASALGVTTEVDK